MYSVIYLVVLRHEEGNSDWCFILFIQQATRIDYDQVDQNQAFGRQLSSVVCASCESLITVVITLFSCPTRKSTSILVSLDFISTVWSKWIYWPLAVYIQYHVLRLTTDTPQLHLYPITMFGLLSPRQVKFQQPYSRRVTYSIFFPRHWSLWSGDRVRLIFGVDLPECGLSSG